MPADNKTFKIKEGVSITDEVVAIIAGLAATEVEGVSSLEGNLKNQALEKAGYKKLSKGVMVNISENEELYIRISINTEYGGEIPEICKQVQDKVKSTVENMTGLVVTNVDVIVSSVILDNIE